MAWITIFVAGLFEVAWAFALKASQGLTLLWPSVVTIVCMILSFVLLAVGMKQLPLGTAYAVWTGIGAVGSAIAGIIFLGESASLLRVLSILLIAAGIIGLKIAQN